jgi:hypothetical protein
VALTTSAACALSAHSRELGVTFELLVARVEQVGMTWTSVLGAGRIERGSSTLQAFTTASWPLRLAPYGAVWS